MKILLCALAFVPGAASAMSGLDYLAHCRATTVYDRAQCMGYLDALLSRNAATGPHHASPEAEGLLDVNQSMLVDDYCLPSGTQLPLLRDVVVRMLEGMPTRRLAGDAGELISGVLRRTYPPPCTP